FGQLGPPHGGTHDAVAPQADFQAVPIHDAPAEDPGQGPERHAEAAQEQRVADLVGIADHVGQHEAGPDGERLAGLAPDATRADAQLDGGAGVLEAITIGEVPGEEFRAVAEGAVEPGTEPLRVVDDISVCGFVDGQADGRTGAGQGSPPRCAGYTKGDSWPFSLPSLSVRAHTNSPRPKLRDGQEKRLNETLTLLRKPDGKAMLRREGPDSYVAEIVGPEKWPMHHIYLNSWTAAALISATTREGLPLLAKASVKGPQRGFG